MVNASAGRAAARCVEGMVAPANQKESALSSKVRDDAHELCGRNREHALEAQMTKSRRAPSASPQQVTLG